MLGRRLRWVAAALTAVSFAAVASPAFADGTPDVYEQSILPGANTAIKNFLNSQQKQEVTRRQATSVS
ncbi:MAG: hypothetical protein WBE59_14420, partial [Candidatus Cybelea sp.]